MNKITKLVIVLVVVAGVAVAAVMMQSGKDNDKEATKSSSTNTSATNSDSSGSTTGSNSTGGNSGTGTSTDNGNASGPTSSTPASGDVAVTIIYDGNTFNSSKDTMKVGQKVTVLNKSTSVLDFDSDPHPVHTDNTELNVGDIEPGESKTFVIDKVGTWGYHNHLNSSQHGEITVQKN